MRPACPCFQNGPTPALLRSLAAVPGCAERCGAGRHPAVLPWRAQSAARRGTRAGCCRRSRRARHRTPQRGAARRPTHPTAGCCRRTYKNSSRDTAGVCGVGWSSRYGSAWAPRGSHRGMGAGGRGGLRGRGCSVQRKEAPQEAACSPASVQPGAGAAGAVGKRGLAPGAAASRQNPTSWGN